MAVDPNVASEAPQPFRVLICNSELSMTLAVQKALEAACAGLAAPAFAFADRLDELVTMAQVLPPDCAVLIVPNIITGSTGREGIERVFEAILPLKARWATTVFVICCYPEYKRLAQLGVSDRFLNFPPDAEMVKLAVLSMLRLDQITADYLETLMPPDDPER